MSKLRIGVAVSFALLLSSSAFAQATRTWVSGVGDDVNPCSRTAPCKTFAGAISKTAANGEISVLDPGGFGTINITKGMRIDGRGVVASALASLTTGVIVNTSDRVTITNIQINGANSGTTGINVIATGGLTIENCDITNFTTNGVNIGISTTAAVQIVNSRITNIPTGNAVQSTTTAGNTVHLSISDSLLSKANIGLRTNTGTRATVTNSVITGNVTGAQADGASIINLAGTTVAGNSGFGLVSLANSSAIRVFASFVRDNISGGFNVSAPSGIFTAGNNSIEAGTGVLQSIGQQ